MNPAGAARSASSFVTSRPVAILMVFVAAFVFGFLSYKRLPVTLMPELTYPTITVRTEYPGAAPEEVENDVSRPIEEAVGVIGGLKKLSSVSRAGISDVVLEFAWDMEMSDATQSVLEKIDQVFLPEEAKRPLILHYDPSLDPVMELSLYGEGERFEGESGLRRLRRLADLRVKKDLEPIKGVAAVRVRGGLEEEIHVLLEEEALRRSNISIQQVILRLGQENINVAGGTLKEGRTEYLVRTLNEFENLGQIADTVVTTYEGRDVRIKDLGQVVRAHREREILTRTDGGESVQIEIYKEGDANIVGLAQRVKATLGEFDFDSPEEAVAAAGLGGGGRAGPPGDGGGLSARLYREEGAKLQVVADRSLFIESSIKEVRNTAIFGGLLAVCVLYMFLRNFKSTAIIAVSIPMSLAITFAPLNLLGVSLNIMSLGGLALGIGMLVDSSIVVLESIHRCRQEGDDLRAAADRGTLEVRSAVLASTFTSIAVFLPMVFVEGIAGQAFGDLGLAVVVSLLASAAVALFFIPMLASRRSRKVSSSGGFYFDYFDTGQWIRLRDGFTRRAGIASAVAFPIFGVRFLYGFHAFYVRRAWREQKQFSEYPRWFKLLNAHNWLIRALVLLPLPFLAEWLGRIERGYLKIVRGILGELRDDVRAMPRLRRIVWGIPLALRAVLSLPLPHLLLPWPWVFLFAGRSWQIVRQDYRRVVAARKWVRITMVVTIVPLVAVGLYLLLRWLFGSTIEAVGLVIVALFQFLALLFVRVLAPSTALIFGALTLPLVRLTDRAMGGLKRTYPGILRAALAHPALVVVVVVACCWGTWQVVKTLDSELLPEVHQGEFTVEVRLPVGTPLERTEEIVGPVEQAILTERENIESLILTVGYDSTDSQGSDEGEHTARFKVLLDEKSRGAETEQAVVARLRTNFEGIPDLDARIERPVLFSSKTPIEVEVHGNDLYELKQHTDLVLVEMARLSELADVEATLQSGAPEVQIIYDRDRLARYDLNIREVARLVRDKVQGFEATRFNLKDRRIPIIVRLNMDDRETVEDVRGIIINPGADRPIRLAAIAEVSLGEGPSEVRRIDGRRVAVVNASIAGGSLSGATQRIEETLNRRIDWPNHMTFFITGQNEEWEASQRSLWVALALSVFLVYVIMAAQFESLIHPLVIMLTIPLAFVGTVFALKLLGLPLSIVVFLGMIMLAGIVVNNAIVLVDYINTLRRRGQSRDEAIITAGSVRLRPILMTTATTVLGLTPMALGLGDGAEIRTPMAIAVISGLLSSTALTLVVIPTFYALADSLKSRLLGSETVSRDEMQPRGTADLGSGSDPVTP